MTLCGVVMWNYACYSHMSKNNNKQIKKHVHKHGLLRILICVCRLVDRGEDGYNREDGYSRDYSDGWEGSYGDENGENGSDYCETDSDGHEGDASVVGERNNDYGNASNSGEACNVDDEEDGDGRVNSHGDGDDAENDNDNKSLVPAHFRFNYNLQFSRWWQHSYSEGL